MTTRTKLYYTVRCTAPGVDLFFLKTWKGYSYADPLPKLKVFVAGCKQKSIHPTDIFGFDFHWTNGRNEEERRGTPKNVNSPMNRWSGEPQNNMKNQFRN